MQDHDAQPSRLTRRRVLGGMGIASLALMSSPATAEIEDNINRGRTAFVTAGIAALRGGMPIRVNGEVVGAVGVAGLSMENDTGIANTAAAALSPLPKTARRR